MNKKLVIYLGIFIGLVALIMYGNTMSNKPVNWFPSFAAKDKIPYGTYILREQLMNLFPNTEVKDIRVSPYVYLQDSTRSGTYLFIDRAVNFDPVEFKEILEFVARGNDVFVSTRGANVDTLQLKTSNIVSNALEETVTFYLSNPYLFQDSIHFDRQLKNYRFTKIDTASTQVLGRIKIFNGAGKKVKEGVNFIRHPFGKGNFYFHTFPEAFTNYNILKENNEAYTSGLLSYIDDKKPILWDMHYKTGKTQIVSPLHYLFENEALRWAYSLILVGLVFYVIFGGKRTQRYIPVIQPLRNQSIAFTRTIAHMYFESKNHKEIAHQSIRYFYDYIRTQFYIPTEIINESFYKHLAHRSGHKIEEVKAIFQQIDRIEKAQQISKQELIALNRSIEKFKV